MEDKTYEGALTIRFKLSPEFAYSERAIMGRFNNLIEMGDYTSDNMTVKEIKECNTQS